MYVSLQMEIFSLDASYKFFGTITQLNLQNIRLQTSRHLDLVHISSVTLFFCVCHDSYIFIRLSIITHLKKCSLIHKANEV